MFSFLVQNNTALFRILMIAKAAPESYFIVCSLLVTFQVVVAGGLVVAKLAEMSLPFVHFPNTNVLIDLKRFDFS